MSVLLRWLQMRTPREEDGNNFGVEVQAQFHERLIQYEKMLEQIFDDVKSYHYTRAEGTVINVLNLLKLNFVLVRITILFLALRKCSWEEVNEQRETTETDSNGNREVWIFLIQSKSLQVLYSLTPLFPISLSHPIPGLRLKVH